MYNENQIFRPAAPPTVNKVDGRARILRPQRQPPQHIVQVVKSTPPPNPHQMMTSSSSAPVLTAKVQTRQPQPSQSVQNDARNVISETVFAERAQVILKRLRIKMRDLTSDVERALSTKHREDREKVVASCDGMKRAYGDLEKWSRMKLRKAPHYQPLANVYQKLNQLAEQRPDTTTQFECLPDTINTQSNIERNILHFSDIFRPVYNAKPRPTLTTPPIFSKLKRCQERNEMVIASVDVLEKKLMGQDSLPWKYSQVENMITGKSCLVYEVLYSEKKVHKEFVPLMKSVLFIKFGELVDLTIGKPDENLYDEENLLPSKHSWYRKITVSARSQLLCRPIAFFSTASNFVYCNSYIQNYVNCSMMPCAICKKFLLCFEPPCKITRENPPQVCHDLCFQYNL